PTHQLLNVRAIDDHPCGARDKLLARGQYSNAFARRGAAMVSDGFHPDSALEKRDTHLLAFEPHFELCPHCDDCVARRSNDERSSGIMSNLEQHLSSDQADIAAQARIIDLEYGVGVEDDCRSVLERGRRALAGACAKHEMVVTGCDLIRA